jgi:hypothetical protein
MTNKVKKTITVNNHTFHLEIYIQLEGVKDVTWEIFPKDYHAALYAFSNKNKINKLIEEQYIYEPTNKLNVPRVRLENTN